MKNKGGIAFLLILLAGGGYCYYHTQLSSSFLSKKKMEVAGKEHDVRSKEGLEKIGLTVRRIPNKDNAAILYVKASNVGEKSKGSVRDKVRYVARNRWITDTDFTHWFDRNQQRLKLVHKAVRKPACEFPVLGDDDEPAHMILLPHLSPMREFAFILACEGKRYEYKRDTKRALDSCLAITSLAEHIHDSNAMLINDVVTIACHGIGNRAVEGCLVNKRVSVEDLRRVIEHYEHVVESHITLADSLTREKACADSIVEEIMRNPREAARLLAELTTPVGKSRSVSKEKQQSIARLIETRGAEMKAAFERDYKALERWSALPAWQALRPGKDWEAYINKLPQACVFSRELLPALDAKKLYAGSKAHTAGVLLFAAIKLYEKKNGRPPGALGDLVPECLSKLPKDPFSGRGYIYKVRGSEWILYSVWDNLRDDGGAGKMPHDYKNDKDFVFWSKPIPIKPPPR